jgi:phosphoribosylanthranilate isomerase
MRTRIKVCCIMTAKEAAMAIAAGADALGLVAEMPSGPGPIPDDLIAEIAATVPPPVATFLLTSRVTAKEIAAHVGACGTNTVQVVSHIDPAEHELLAALRPATRRVQVIHVESEEALRLIREYAPLVHAFLLDSGRPASAELGGTGRVHDWAVSAEFVRRSPLPVFLAGGLNPENAAQAVTEVKPFGLDLCSGVRTGGKLDAEKLHAFFAAARGGRTPPL